MSQVTQGPEILLAGGERACGSWRAVVSERKAREAKLRGFLVASTSLPFFPPLFLSSTLFLALSEEALMRIPLII